MLSACFVYVLSFDALSYDLMLQEKRYGPFTQEQMRKWSAKGFFDAMFSIMHAPSAVWLPLSYMMQINLYQLSGLTFADVDDDTVMSDDSVATLCLHMRGFRDTDLYQQVPVRWPCEIKPC